MDLEAGEYSVIRDGLKKVLKSSRFGAEVVRRLQSFSAKPEFSQVSETAEFDLSDIAKKAAEVSHVWLTDADRKGIRISLHTRLKGRCLVNADKNEIFGVIVQPHQERCGGFAWTGGDIDLTTAVERDKVVLQVRDTGIGVSQENLGRLFNPFFTTKAEARRRFESWLPVSKGD